MTRKLSFVLAFVLALSLVLVACQRSASPSVLPTPTPGSETSPSTSDAGAEGEDDLMAELQTFATQTAIAAAGAGGPTSTPIPPVVPTESGASALPSPTGTVHPSGVVTPGAIYPTAVVTRPGTYVLMKGEYPFCVARRFNVNQYELLNLNGLQISQGGSLPVGYTLQIPQTGTPFEGTRALHPHPATHVVQGDETIYKVACFYGDVAPEAIIAANGLAAPYLLTVGQQLSIP